MAEKKSTDWVKIGLAIAVVVLLLAVAVLLGIFLLGGMLLFMGF